MKKKSLKIVQVCLGLIEFAKSNLQISRRLFLLIIIIEKMLRNFEFAFVFAFDFEFTLFGIGFYFV